MSLNIEIKTIPNDEQRYPTVGDWLWENDKLTIYVSDMGNWKYEALVGIHELCEVLLCKDRGVTQQSVDAFDKAFETNREEGDLSEPGDAASAPYKNEHFFATSVERLVARELNVDWAIYDNVVTNL